MHFHVMTLFPQMVLDGLHTSIIGRAEERGIITVEAVNIRDYTLDRHKKVDDYPYGGGAGMLMQAQPVYDCYRAVCDNISLRKINEKNADSADGSDNVNAADSAEDACVSKPRVVYVTPQGELFTQKKAAELSNAEDLIFLCGHYEGVDERVLEEIVTDYISIGDYVLTGGELPAMVIIDAVSRLVGGVLSNDESAQTESHSNGLLEYPQYSRPEEWRGRHVPEVLLSGHHANIEKWRAEQAVERTRQRRPDMYEKYLGSMGKV